MHKIRKLLKALGIIARKPYLLNLVLNTDENWENFVRRNHPGFLSLPKVSLKSMLGESEALVHPFSFLDGGSLPTDLAVLTGLAKQIPGCSYFEIGTWRGESVANVSRVAAKCFTMDLPDQEKRELGMTDAYIAQHAMLSHHLSNVTHLKANSFHFDFTSLNQKFDLIFIDGDHHYDALVNDTKRVFASLVHEKTIVVWHDYGYNPESIRYEVLAGILDGLDKVYHDKLYHVANTMCAVYLPEGATGTKEDIPVFEIRMKING